ncbi:hypothetical protein [Candidatus Nitrospira bockiana]
MIRHVRSADDLAWLLTHTQAFPGGQITDLAVHKQRLFDEASGREITAGTVITTVIRYDVAIRGVQGLYSISRVAKLTMRGVTDFSIFEQEGADFSDIGLLHAEMSGGRLRFWFDPHGELYVICDEATIEEVSRPGSARPIRSGMTEWTFQAETGDLPDVEWFLERLDQAGLPCAWREIKLRGRVHPAARWAGHFLPASAHGLPRAGSVYIQTYGPLDGYRFGITLRASDPHEEQIGRLLMVLADIVARGFSGMCLAGNHVMERDEWLGGQGVGRDL